MDSASNVSTLERTKRAERPVETSIEVALALHQKGMLEQALAIYRNLLERDPNHFDALHMLGVAELQRGHGELAVDLIGRALAQRRDDPIACSNLGSALGRVGRLEDALHHYDRALELQPDHVDAHYNRGVLLLRMGRFDEALAALESVTQLRPEHVGAVLQQAHTLRKAGRLQSAVEVYFKVLEMAPENSDACFGYGLALRGLKQHQDAFDQFDAAVRLKPDFAEAWINRGNCLRDLDRPEQALHSYERAIGLDPASVRAHSSKGAVLNDLLRPQEALVSYTEALACDPEDAEAHWNRGLCLLQMGRLTDGWQECEWRWRHKGFSGFRTWRNFAQPLWRGDAPLQGRTILLHAEQGLGDTIQFSRYAALVKARGATVILEVQRPLLRLLEGLEGVDQIIARGDVLPGFDLHCPLLSLPLALGTERDSIPASPRYLRARSNRLKFWQERLGAPTLPRVGLVWSGNPEHANDRRRSIALAEALRMMPPGLDVICLHKDIRSEDRLVLAQHPQVRQYADEIKDFTDTAALCELVDLVVSVDTSVAHLAAALGRPVWLLLPFNPDWRWMLERRDSPWYPTLRLLRQRAIGDWSSVFAQVRHSLKRMAQPTARAPTEVFAATGMTAPTPKLTPTPAPTQAASPPSAVPATVAVAAMPSLAEQLRMAADLHTRGQLTQARELYLQVLAQQPQQFDALHMLGVIELSAGRAERAAELIGSALQLQPQQVAAWYNLGIARDDGDQHEDAVACYRRAIALQPEHAQTWCNMANSLKSLGRFDEAVEAFDQAIRIKPDYARAHLNLSLCQLLLGRYRGGLERHEWRWRDASLRHMRREFSQPVWLGDAPLQGRTILLHAEQGLGDTIQFCRYAALVKALGATVILEVQPALRQLLHGIDGVDQLIVRGDALPHFDLHCPLLSLPLALGTEPDNIPAWSRYLPATPAARLQSWEQRLGPRRRPRVGLVWSGNPAHANDRRRSLTLVDVVRMLPLGCDYVCLHHEIRAADREVLARYPEIRAWTDELQDFTDTAALCDLMDVVISVDTSVAHLAGALGRPVWLLLPFNPDWRWLLERHDSPWYPTARLYRQPLIGDWTTALEQVRRDLLGLVAC